MAGRDTFDLVDEIAYPLPVIVIAEMLGVPPEDRADFKRWSDDDRRHARRAVHRRRT